VSTTFANVSVRTDQQEAVYDLLDDGEAFISPPILGWVTVFDRQASEGDVARLAELAARLSEALDSVALAFLVIDADAFFYLLFERGVLKDEYASDPDFFGDASPEERRALRGQSERLAALAIPGARIEQFRAILDSAEMPAADRCRAIAARLGIENATLGYHDLAAKAEGSDVPVVGWDLFDYTGSTDEGEARPDSPSQNGHRS
jgi:hypothetical protein